MPSVSVIIPNYNRGAIIGETINNMLEQSLPPHEIIVVDDGSTDNSVEVISRFGTRVKLIQQSNRGPGAARNAGLKIATGEFIQFMDSDDLASKNKLQAQAAQLLLKNADIVYGPWVKVWKKDKVISLQDVVLQQQQLPATKHPLQWFLTEWSMVFQHCLVRKSLLDKVGGYREDIHTNEDSDLFVRLLLAGAQLVYESASLTFYRLHDLGKLTTTGSTLQSRAADAAVFYYELIKQAQSHPLLINCLQESRFKIRVWILLQDLKSNRLTENDVYTTLKDFLRSGNLQRRLLAWVIQKQGGLRQRIRGHRWTGAFKAAPITSKQQQLIADLEWQIQ